MDFIQVELIGIGIIGINFLEWCESSFLTINVAKTKEMTIDFGKNPVVTPPVVLNNQVVEVVNQYKYLGILVDNKLTFETQVDAVCKKVHQRMYFYRKLRNFSVDNTFILVLSSLCSHSLLFAGTAQSASRTEIDCKGSQKLAARLQA